MRRWHSGYCIRLQLKIRALSLYSMRAESEYSWVRFPPSAFSLKLIELVKLKTSALRFDFT